MKDEVGIYCIQPITHNIQRATHLQLITFNLQLIQVLTTPNENNR